MRYDCYEMARPKCYETAALKQKAYRERKKNLSGGGKQLVQPDNAPPAAHKFETKKVGEFRMLVMPEEAKDEPTMPVAKPKVFLNDHGAVISERVWEQLQEKKRIAKENGYEFDPQ